ncbi:hypothetical protein B0H13DRAFT_2317697 [Mycena leptocephala]|nr:hypothetical protein B0H13DRAFT_2317697 [Mycena leptocephala]
MPAIGWCIPFSWAIARDIALPCVRRRPSVTPEPGSLLPPLAEPGWPLSPRLHGPKPPLSTRWLVASLGQTTILSHARLQLGLDCPVAQYPSTSAFHHALSFPSSCIWIAEGVALFGPIIEAPPSSTMPSELNTSSESEIAEDATLWGLAPPTRPSSTVPSEFHTSSASGLAENTTPLEPLFLLAPSGFTSGASVGTWMDRALTQRNGRDPDSSDCTLVSNDADLESLRTSQNIPLSSSPMLTDTRACALLDSTWTFINSSAELVPHLESDTGPRVDQTATPIWLGGYGNIVQLFICPTVDNPGCNSPALHHSVSPILESYDVIEGDSDPLALWETLDHGALQKPGM